MAFTKFSSRRRRVTARGRHGPQTVNAATDVARVDAAIARVDALRLRPTNCSYCPAAAATSEHVLAEAIGGRLTAPILCGHHNGLVSPADRALVEHFEVLTYAASVQRQRGGRARVKFSTRLDVFDGQRRRTRIEPDGKSTFGTEYERNAQGIIQRARGALPVLEKLRPITPTPTASVSSKSFRPAPPSRSLSGSIPKFFPAC